MSQSALQLAFANVALRPKQCGADKSSMRPEAESRTTLGILAIIDERIVVQGYVIYCIEEMFGRSLKLALKMAIPLAGSGQSLPGSRK